MFVIEVIPLRRGIQINTLSYFSAQKISLGSLVQIPVKNNTIIGVVSSVEEAGKAKTAIRAATFSLRKLPLQEDIGSLSPEYMKTAIELSEYYACSVGAVIHALLPPEIQNGDVPLPNTPPLLHSSEKNPPQVLQANKRERYLTYRSLVRETFARGGSIICATPSAVSAHEMFKLLSTGIEDRTTLLTGFRTKKELKRAYEELDDFSKPRLIITTPSHSVIERYDISTIIVEDARSAHFMERTRPYLDYRVVLKIHAKHTGRQILFGDLLPRCEEEYFRRKDVYGTHGETPKRLELPGKIQLVPMKDKPSGATPFVLFSPTVIEGIKNTLKERGRTFLFCARKGIAPVVACVDCAYIFRSPDSGAPYSLIRKQKNGKEERWFVCSTSGHRERAADVCPHCGSWRLKERGIGIQHVYDELSRELKETPLILFDHTTANTYKKASFLQQKFLTSKGSIMLGTQMAIPYITDPIDTSVVVNVDALYATPTWRLQEENFSLLLRLREQTKGTVYIQTRSKADELITHAKNGSVEKFYNEEMELRQTFNYPPYTIFIHLAWQGNPAVLAKLEAEIKRAFVSHTISIYSAPPTPKGDTLRFCLIRVAERDWPDTKLEKILKSLSPAIRVMINPEKIV